jgi:hypothetical protein
MGITPAGPFDLEFTDGLALIREPNPSGAPSSDVVRPYFNGKDLNQRPREAWTIDFGVDSSMEEAARYDAAFQHIEKVVKPIRVSNRRESYATSWWLYAESRPAMRNSFKGLRRFLATCMVAKHRLFAWLDTSALPANVVIVFARDDDYFFGVLHSRFHEVWALAQGTQLREKESGFRYTPTTCFETFPLPDESLRDFAAWRENISAAAKALNELRERWLNPPEWTKTEVLEFPGTVGGPWDRYVLKSETRNLKPGDVGTVRYPRLVPKDAECAAKLKARTLTQLYNERPTWLDLAHKKLDAAVAAAYGWPADLSEEAILEKLLQLNLARAAAQPPAVASKKSRRATADQHQGQLF